MGTEAARLMEERAEYIGRSRGKDARSMLAEGSLGFTVGWPGTSRLQRL